MGANRYISDSSGTTRHIRKRYIADSSGVTRLIRKRYVADASGVGRLTFLLADPFSGVAGVNGSFGVGFFAAVFGTINGSGVPFPLSGGSALASIYNTVGPTNSILQVQSLGADPGSGWLRYIQIGTTQKFPTDAGTTYSYSAGGGGTGTWRWTTAFPTATGGGFSGSQPFTGQISHN